MKPTDKKKECFSAKTFNISQNGDQEEVFTPHLLSAHSTIEKKEPTYGTFNVQTHKAANRRSLDMPLQWNGGSNPIRSSDGGDDHKSFNSSTFIKQSIDSRVAPIDTREYVIH